MSGRYSGSPNSGVSFLSNILGISVSRMYVLLGTKYSIFGIILIVSNFLVMLSLITLAKIQSNKFINWILIVVSILLIPVLVLFPSACEVSPYAIVAIPSACEAYPVEFVPSPSACE